MMLLMLRRPIATTRLPWNRSVVPRLVPNSGANELIPPTGHWILIEYRRQTSVVRSDVGETRSRRSEFNG